MPDKIKEIVISKKGRMIRLFNPKKGWTENQANAHIEHTQEVIRKCEEDKDK